MPGLPLQGFYSVTLLVLFYGGEEGEYCVGLPVIVKCGLYCIFTVIDEWDKKLFSYNSSRFLLLLLRTH